MLVASVPDQPDPCTTSIVGENVLISWTAPYDGSSAITGYKVSIRHYDLVNFSEEYENCASDDSIILANRQCSVPVADLVSSPYNLGWGQSVYAKVAAINIVGESVYSVEGNGAVILTVPDHPLNLQNVQD